MCPQLLRCHKCVQGSFVPAAPAAGGFQMQAETKGLNETPSLGYLANVSLHLSPYFTPAHTDSHPENIYFPFK